MGRPKDHTIIHDFDSLSMLDHYELISVKVSRFGKRRHIRIEGQVASVGADAATLILVDETRFIMTRRNYKNHRVIRRRVARGDYVIDASRPGWRGIVIDLTDDGAGAVCEAPDKVERVPIARLRTVL